MKVGQTRNDDSGGKLEWTGDEGEWFWMRVWVLGGRGRGVEECVGVRVSGREAAESTRSA